MNGTDLARIYMKEAVERVKRGELPEYYEEFLNRFPKKATTGWSPHYSIAFEKELKYQGWIEIKVKVNPSQFVRTETIFYPFDITKLDDFRLAIHRASLNNP